MTKIEWTDETWNPVVGCSRASRGCDHCYAVTMSHRLEKMGGTTGDRYAGLTVLNSRDERHFNGVVRTVPEVLGKPLKWRKPRRVFVNSMGDLFHEKVPFEFIDRVFAVMALCPQHTFQVLTKRPERMAEYLIGSRRNIPVYNAATEIVNADFDRFPGDMATTRSSGGTWWPLPNVWLGTSVEDQEAAELRIGHLLRCPAAVRFLSCEPLLGPVRLDWVDALPMQTGTCQACGEEVLGGLSKSDCCGREVDDQGATEGVDWVIVGGESGSGARSCHAGWIRSIVEQCKGSGVACFVKQLGPWPAVDPVPEGPIEHACCMRLDGTDYAMGRGDRGMWGAGEKDVGWSSIESVPDGVLVRRRLRDRKGGDPGEWPGDLRVREVPGEGAE